MKIKIQEFNETLIQDLKTVGVDSFQQVLRRINKKWIILDSDQILGVKRKREK